MNPQMYLLVARAEARERERHLQLRLRHGPAVRRFARRVAGPRHAASPARRAKAAGAADAPATGVVAARG